MLPRPAPAACSVSSRTESLCSQAITHQPRSGCISQPAHPSPAHPLPASQTAAKPLAQSVQADKQRAHPVTGSVPSYPIVTASRDAVQPVETAVPRPDTRLSFPCLQAPHPATAAQMCTAERPQQPRRPCHFSPLRLPPPLGVHRWQPQVAAGGRPPRSWADSCGSSARARGRGHRRTR
jgi:hypothetical protein